MPDFTYRRNERGIVVRSDGVLIPEHDPENISFKLLQEWLAEGNELNPEPPEGWVTGPDEPPGGWITDPNPPTPQPRDGR